SIGCVVNCPRERARWAGEHLRDRVRRGGLTISVFQRQLELRSKLLWGDGATDGALQIGGLSGDDEGMRGEDAKQPEQTDRRAAGQSEGAGSSGSANCHRSPPTARLCSCTKSLPSRLSPGSGGS